MNKMAGKQSVVPRLRFPGFKGNWEEVALGDVSDIKLGKMLDRKKHTTGNLLPYLNNQSVRWNDVDTSNLPRMYFQDDELDRFGLRADDVVVCEGGAPGRSAVWDGRLPDIKFQKAVHRVRFNIPFEPHLLVAYLELIAGTSQFEKLFTGGGIKHLTRATFAQLRIPSTSHAEQQRIASCLSSLDACIGAGTRKLDALKTHKQSLLQHLFPAEGQRLARLRFQEFTEEWKESKAGSLFSNRLEAGEDDLPVFAVTMYDGMVVRSSIDRRVDDIAEAKGNRKVHKGDIAYNMMRMWQGASGVAPQDCMVSPAYVILATKAGGCSEFFGYLLKRPSTLQQLTSHSQGLTQDRLRLYYKDFATILMLRPAPAEQRKIAACLSSLDELIALQSRKMSALQQHKKGLMQGLFPATDA